MRFSVERAPRPSDVLGELEGQRFRVALTGADALWCARMCAGEEGERDASYAGSHAVVSTMLRRLAFINDARVRAGRSPSWRDLTDLIVGRDRNGDGSLSRNESGFSQPISLYWRNIDSPAIPGDERPRRQRISTASWEALPEAARAAVIDCLTGRTRLSARTAVDFADARMVARALATRPASEGWQRVRANAANHFLSNAASRRYPEPRVRGDGVFPFPSGVVIAAGALAFLVATGVLVTA